MVLIGIDEVAEMVGVSTSTVRYWRQMGTGPASARIGRQVKYRKDDVEAWINAQFAN